MVQPAEAEQVWAHLAVSMLVLGGLQVLLRGADIPLADTASHLREL